MTTVCPPPFLFTAEITRTVFGSPTLFLKNCVYPKFPVLASLSPIGGHRLAFVFLFGFVFVFFSRPPSFC